MERATDSLSPGGGGVLLPSSVTLAFQRMRQTWRLLSLVGVGMLASVILVCAVPLYSQVAMTAGLRGALTSPSQSTDIVVRGTAYSVSSESINQLTQSLNQEFQRNLGPYLLPGQFSLQTTPFYILEPGRNGKLHLSGDQLGMIGTDVAHAASHLKFVAGHLPGTVVSGNTIEIAIRSETADILHWGIGTVIPVNVEYVDQTQGTQTASELGLKVVGIFNLAGNDDSFWHGEDFLSSPTGVDTFAARSLVANDALISWLSQATANATLANSMPGQLIWYHTLDTAHIQISDINPILQGIQRIQVDNGNNTLLDQQSMLQRVQTYLPSDTLAQYASRLPIVQFPVTSLLVLVLCLVLFFVSLMTGILVDRQAGAIALLRSRGATSGQIFWSLVTQALILGLIAVAVGPLLAIVLVRVLAPYLLTTADLGALNILAGNPIPVVLGVGFYALITACAMALTMILAIWGTASRDVLALRREAARSTHRPLWQRLNLDMLALLVALVGAGFSIYLTNSNALDTRLRLLFLSPLTLLEALCVLLAAMLLLLRGFPLLLRAGAWIASRLRGAASLVALAQMSRAPRQSVCMTLLLALATAFTIFTLVFNASQTRRIQDVSDYQAGADISGSVPMAFVTPQQLASATQVYKRLPGALSGSLGYVKVVTAGGATFSLPMNFQAVDSSTFPNTARWSSQDSAQPLADLLRQLASARTAALSKGAVPAIVDANTWNELHLSPGANFTLNFSAMGALDLFNFKAVAEVQHIPTAGNSSLPGVLVDYLTFFDVYTHNYTLFSDSSVPVNYVWLRTSDDPVLLNSLRRALSQSYIFSEPFNDRRQMVQQLTYEPLYLTLAGILLLGATTALLLALLGNLVASWLNAHSRLANFAALRALGATPRQIASVLAWEQVIIYTTALLLGFLFGWLLAVLALPALVFTSVLPGQITSGVDRQTFYTVQNTPPIQIVFPTALWIALAALVLLCIVALGMMVRIVSRPSIAQVLRLNED